jgi:hypothetical protein
VAIVAEPPTTVAVMVADNENHPRLRSARKKLVVVRIFLAEYNPMMMIRLRYERSIERVMS